MWRRTNWAVAVSAVLALQSSLTLAQEAEPPPSDVAPPTEPPPSESPPTEAPAPAEPPPEPPSEPPPAPPSESAPLPSEPAPPPPAPPPAAPPSASPPPVSTGAFPTAPPKAPPAATPPPATKAPPVAAPAPAAPPRTEPVSVTPADRAPVPPAAESERAAESEADEHGVFRIGLVLGTGLPSLLSIGGTLKLTRYLGAGATFGLIPSVKLSYYGDAVLAYQHYDIYGRIYPFGGAFFLGAGAGYVTVEGTLEQSVDVSAYAGQYPGLSGTVSYTSQGSVRTLVLTPVIGIFHTFDSGFSLGIDAGVQIPIAPSEIEFDSDADGNIPTPIVEQYLAPIDASVVDTLETIGRTPLPTVNLRIGWLF